MRFVGNARTVKKIALSTGIKKKTSQQSQDATKGNFETLGLSLDKVCATLS